MKKKQYGEHYGEEEIIMPTPDFEDWLDRQDIPIEETTVIDDYLKYLEDNLGIHKGSLDVARDQWTSKYEILPDAGIRPIERTYEIAGEKFAETRYAITGEPGLWGKISAYRIAEERMMEQRQFEKAAIARGIMIDAESSPPARRRVYED